MMLVMAGRRRRRLDHRRAAVRPRGRRRRLRARTRLRADPHVPAAPGAERRDPVPAQRRLDGRRHRPHLLDDLPHPRLLAALADLVPDQHDRRRLRRRPPRRARGDRPASCAAYLAPARRAWARSRGSTTSSALACGRLTLLFGGSYFMVHGIAEPARAADADRRAQRREQRAARRAPAPHRRARPPRPRARRGQPPHPGGQSRQEPVPGQHEPRAAHAAQLDHRLLRDPRRQARRPDRAALRRASCTTSSAAGATCSA